MISKPKLRTVALLLASLSLVSTSAFAQGQRPVAIVNANVITLEGKPIKMGMVLFRNGKIVDVGKKLKIPAGAKIIDAKGGSVMPGLVSAYSRAGLGGGARQVTRFPRGRRGRGRRFPRPARGGGGRGGNKAATKVITGLYTRQKIFHELAELGVTTLALSPSGGGFPGQGAVLDPVGKNLEELTIDDAAFLMVNPSNSTAGKKLMKDTFEKAKKVLEERKKPKPTPKPTKPTTPKKPAGKTTAKKPTSKPAEKGEKKEEKKPTPPAKKPAKPATRPRRAPPKKRKDPNLEVLADLLDGKHRAFITLDSPAKVLHYLDAVGDVRFKSTIYVPRFGFRDALLTAAMEQIKSLKAPILMPPQMTSKPFTTQLVNPAADFVKAGIEVGFILSDDKFSIRDQLFANLIELVRHGLDRDAALKGVTLVPAKMIGAQDRVGSIKKGKDADLLLFSGDPLDPTSQLVTVWRKGTEVKKKAEVE